MINNKLGLWKAGIIKKHFENVFINVKSSHIFEI